MFRKLLAAAAVATGVGLVGTADTAEAHGRYYGSGYGYRHGGYVRIQPYPYYGWRQSYYGYPRYGYPRYGYPRYGGYYGRPWYGGSGFSIGTNNFHFSYFDR